MQHRSQDKLSERKREINTQTYLTVKNQDLPTHSSYFFFIMVLIFSVSLGLLCLFFLTNSSFTQASDYLYANLDDENNNANEDALPIIDYVKPKKKPLETESQYGKRLMNPSFLSDSFDKPRCVEFYAPWCGHCRHYKPHYIELGKQVQVMNPEVQFYAISCTVHNNLCKENKIRGYPTVKFYSSFNSTGTVVDHHDMNHAKDFIVRYILTKDDTIQYNGVESMEQKSKTKLNLFPKYQVDLHPNHHDIYVNVASSLSFAFRTSIYLTNDSLSRRQHDALLDWLQLLSTTLPRNVKHTELSNSLNQVESLLSNIEHVTESEQNFVNTLIKSGKLNLQEQWTQSCSRGISGEGYTCGLWQLLHTVTVGLVHYNNDATSINNIPPWSTNTAAFVIRNYIEEFFTCDECRLNFIKMYEECYFDRCNRLRTDIGLIDDWKQLPLWLWEVHNDVNVRLLGKKLKENGDTREISDSDKASVRWPSKSECPECWNEYGGWDEDNVYTFLESVYWPISNNMKQHIHQSSEIINENLFPPIYIIPVLGIILLIGFICLRANYQRTKLLKK